MPSSDCRQIPVIMDIINVLKPKTVLDVGIGRGKYGFLCREYFPNIDVIDGVEAWADYVTPVQRHVYSNIFTGTIQEWVDKLPAYDLALLIDVSEHLPLDEVYSVIEVLQSKCSAIVLATPATFLPQGAANGNVFERHLSFISPRDLKKMGFGWTTRVSEQRVALWTKGRSPGLTRFRTRRLIHSLAPPILLPLLRAVMLAVRNLRPPRCRMP